MMKEIVACGAAAAACTALAARFKEGDVVHGFRVSAVERLDEIDATLVRMEYGKNGADLVWLDRDDANKTFAIAFKTVPEDDTGVAHILEHSVLCGSRKYPVKEPFVELLKSSFATFINAWTAPDYTAYPVCSRDGADLLNMMDVYLDAVFHPLSVESPEAFMQEGWHYTRGADGAPDGLNGVVYSEMKGAFSDPRSLAEAELDRLLFRDNAYRFVSGGDPEAIPGLTFERYKAFHAKHYHPSNAKVFLDGSVDIDAALAKLDSYFSGYSRRDIDVAIPPAVPRVESRTVPYPVEDGEDPADRTIVADGRLVCTFRDVAMRLAADVVSQYLAGSNDSPVMKALLDAGLCDDAAIWVSCAEQAYCIFFAENVKDGKADETRAAARRAIEEAVSAGFDKKRLEAIVSKEEFGFLERDFGTYPRGLAFFSGAMDSWLYGGDPASSFRRAEFFAQLRRWIAEGRFEAIAKEIFLENPGCASVTLVPEKGLAAKRAVETSEKIAKTAAAWSDDERRAFAESSARLDAFRNKKDSPEDIAKLPRLDVKDIPEKADLPAFTVEDAGGAKICRAGVHAKGIVYAALAFPVDVSSPEALADLDFATDALGELPTSRRSALELKSEMDANLGRFSANPSSFGVLEAGAGKTDPRGRAYLLVGAAALESKADEILRLVPEILRESDFTQEKKIGDMQKQRRSAMEFSIGGLGAIKFARSRAGSGVSGVAALDDLFKGIGSLRRIQEADDAFAANAKERCAVLARALESVVSRGAEYVFVSANAPEGFAEKLAGIFPYDAARPLARYMEPAGARREGFVCQGQVAAAAKSFRIAETHGGMNVAARILTLGRLWNEIRVLGGAYGASLAVAPSGLAGYLSWNDPSPARTISVFDGAADTLEEFAKAGSETAKADIARYVIGAVAATEPYLAPSAEMALVASLVLSGRDPADWQRIRKEMLATGPAEISAAARTLASPCGEPSICIIGGKEQLESCKGIVDAIAPIRRD